MSVFSSAFPFLTRSPAEKASKGIRVDPDSTKESDMSVVLGNGRGSIPVIVNTEELSPRGRRKAQKRRSAQAGARATSR